VESPSPTPSHANPRPKTSRTPAILWTILICATLYACYFTHLDAVGLVGPDEPRYAWIARDMAESADFITPRLYGKPWFEKPPLYYWSAALSFKLFGISETSARLPSAVFALLATFAIAWLAFRIYGAETARWILLLLPTSAGMIGFSHAAATDMPFAATLTMAMLPAAVLLGLIPASRLERTSSSSYTSSTLLMGVLLGFFLGLATLAKGPAAIILCAGAVFFWALLTKRWRDTIRLLHPSAIISFGVTALPWYILCAIRNPDFFRVFIIEHNFKRFLTPEFQHIQPFWYYTGIIPIAFLPWTAILLWALFAGVKHLRRGPLSSSTIFVLCWSVFCIAFFTISVSKLPGYILPAVPPIGLLLARACTFLAPSKRWPLALSSLLFSALCTAAFLASLDNSERFLRNAVAFKPVIVLVLLLFIVANLLFGILLAFRLRSAALIAAVLPFFLAFRGFGAMTQFTPLSVLSSRYIADQVRADQMPLAQLRSFKLRRATLYGVNFYLRLELQEWNRDPSDEVYVLTEGLHCYNKPAQMNCDDLWIEQERLDVFDVLHLTPKK